MKRKHYLIIIGFLSLALCVVSAVLVVHIIKRGEPTRINANSAPPGYVTPDMLISMSDMDSANVTPTGFFRGYITKANRDNNTGEAYVFSISHAADEGTYYFELGENTLGIPANFLQVGEELRIYNYRNSSDLNKASSIYYRFLRFQDDSTIVFSPKNVKGRDEYSVIYTNAQVVRVKDDASQATLSFDELDSEYVLTVSDYPGIADLREGDTLACFVVLREDNHNVPLWIYVQNSWFLNTELLLHGFSD